MGSGIVLSSDIIEEILKRVDGITLANVECCCCHLRSVAMEERLWEDACRSLWPSTANQEVKMLIYSLGGFKKFYAHCFPLINVAQQPVINSNAGKFYNYIFSVEDDYDDHDDKDQDVDASDFVSLLDIFYINKSIYSKVIWNFPRSDEYRIDCRSSPLFPIVIDFPSCSSDATHLSISNNDINGEEDVESKILSVNLTLSWILINRRTKHAVNLSSWRPLEAQKHNWGCDNNDFTIRFGSILPAHNTNLPLNLAACNIVARCRVEAAMNVQISGVSMQLEDMMGCQMNAREGLLILQRAVEWGKRSKDHDQVIQRCYDVLEIQSDLMEEKLEAQCRIDPLCILFSVGVAVLSCYYFFL